ncbi:NACHT domain-containing protein [Actinosynnema sp. NPDC023587]|uniref:NACHT domain-containing protein n=1 Tax=Actinosynnema sp. NPDC023587 TaxID=3154695 RepID=UPI0033C23428
MSGLEAAAGRTAATVAGKIVGRLGQERQHRVLRDVVRAAVPSQVADDFVAALDGRQAEALNRYLASPDFEEVALQLALWRLLRDRTTQDIEPTLREEVRLGLRHAVGLARERLTTGADVVFDALRVAVEGSVRHVDRSRIDQVTATSAAHLAANAAGNTRLLARVGSLATFHAFAERLRAQVARAHAEIRLPHLGVSRSVPYHLLYVEPALSGLEDLALPGRRSVVLGDPGAGKSTLVAKLAWEIASDPAGRVPFLLVLRDFTTSLREGGRTLVSYLESLCGDPYNLTPPPDAVKYLLRNGRAVVLLDGVDELVDPAVRQRFARLVESFTDLYPLVPIVVTARKIGYETAALDPRAFRTGLIEKFDGDRVRRYVLCWFALDSSTPEHERTQLAHAFLGESAAVSELRSNPLLLALLCAMFSSEHYLPANLAQVYEKCALLLFEQWDRMRGLPMPTRFESYLRGAVGYLAWRQLTAENSGAAWSRGRIVGMLTEYLERKGFDPEESATRFVDFCTGRPWVLSDTGIDRSEPQYGFTHRTFLEFFAADHLVRTNRTAEPLWAALRPMLLTGAGGLVPQIALQLYDQKHEDGGSELLRLIAAEDQFSVTWFAAHSLRYAQPNPTAVRSVVEAAVRLAVRHTVESRFHYWRPWDVVYFKARDDTPLETLVFDSSAANRAVVLKSISAELASGRYDQPVADWLRTSLRLPGEVVRPQPWATVLFGAADLSPLVEEFGPHALYLSFWSGRDQVPSLAERVLMGRPMGLDPKLLLNAPLPWIPGDRWWGELLTATPSPLVVKEHRPLSFLVALPYLESGMTFKAHPTVGRHWGYLLGEARKAAVDVDLRGMALPGEFRDFLRAWSRGEVSVITPVTGAERPYRSRRRG